MKKKVNLLLLMCFMFLIGAKAQVTLGKEQAINMVTITEGSP